MKNAVQLKGNLFRRNTAVGDEWKCLLDCGVFYDPWLSQLPLNVSGTRNVSFLTQRPNSDV